MPELKIFHEYFFLFAKCGKEELDKYGFNYSIHSKYSKKLKNFMEIKPFFDNYEEFIKFCNLK